MKHDRARKNSSKGKAPFGAKGSQGAKGLHGAKSSHSSKSSHGGKSSFGGKSSHGAKSSFGSKPSFGSPSGEGEKSSFRGNDTHRGGGKRSGKSSGKNPGKGPKKGPRFGPKSNRADFERRNAVAFRKDPTPKVSTRSEPPRDNPSVDDVDVSGRFRLQRVLAMAGLGSRRHCEEIILEGRVEVDGQPVTELGSRVDPEIQKIRVDGERLKLASYQYYAVNKPPGVVSTNSDPSGRTRVIDLIKTDYRVYNVGRLDKSSEGLILVTNDGDLANQLTHPKYGVEKTYLIQTVGVPTLEQLQQLEKGIYLAEGKAKAKSAKLIRRNKLGAVIEIVLAEGRNREIRRLLARLGHKVTRLQRVAIGPLGIGPLDVGEHRKLTTEEIQSLRAWCEENRKRQANNPPRKKKSSSKGFRGPSGKP